MVLWLLLLHFEMGSAATYTVGGSSGWTFNVSGWPKGKRFRAGDIIGKSILTHSKIFKTLIIESVIYFE